MSQALVPAGEISDEEVFENHHQGWLNDEVDTRNAEERRENFSSTLLASLSSDFKDDEKVENCCVKLGVTDVDKEKVTNIFMRGNSCAGHEERRWAIPNEVLRQRSNLFSLMFSSGLKTSLLPNLENGNNENDRVETEQPSTTGFREALTNTVVFEYDRAVSFVLTWIERDGKMPIKEIILNENGCADDFVPVIRAAHYLGADEALAHLEQVLSSDEGPIDVDNCLSLLCLAEDLDLHQLKVTCMGFAFRKLEEIKASPFWRDEIAVVLRSQRMDGSEMAASSASEEVRVHFTTINSLRNAARRHGLTGTEFPDAREYLAMLRESLCMQEERLAEAEALADYDERESGKPTARAREVLSEQRNSIEKFREYIALQDAVFQIQLKRHGSVRHLSAPKFELGHALLHVPSIS